MRKFTGYRRRKRYGRKRFGKGKTTRALAKAAIRLAHKEMYFFDTVNTPSSVVSNAGLVTCLTNVAQGDDINNRTGNAITARSLNLRILASGNAQNTINYMRVIVFMDKDNQGSNPAPGDVLQTVGSQVSIISPLKIANLGRFQILYDRVCTFDHQVDYTVGTANNDPVGACNLKLYKRMRTPLRFTGSSGTNIFHNAIFLLVLSDVASNDPVYTFYSRIGYNDA